MARGFLPSLAFADEFLKTIWSNDFLQ